MTVSAVCAQPLAARKFQGSRAKLAAAPKVRAAPRNLVIRAERSGPVTIGLAADSGCGKSTFMRRMTSLFGGKASPPEGGNPDSNTLISDTTTVLCLDDYHLNDRAGRKKSGLTALNLAEQDFGACASGPGPSHQTRQCSARQATRGSFDKDTLGGWDTERSPGWDAGIFLDCPIRTNFHGRTPFLHRFLFIQKRPSSLARATRKMRKVGRGREKEGVRTEQVAPSAPVAERVSASPGRGCRSVAHPRGSAHAVLIHILCPCHVCFGIKIKKGWENNPRKTLTNTLSSSLSPVLFCLPYRISVRQT